ncbi:MAG: sugar phosphate isomerase/epimerase [Planctomycetota bacterium]|nr:sugar phosphate isomerase/epimerase [Planctomycetota bacterium]
MACAGEPAFRISLAQWSLHRTHGSGELPALDFPARARKLGFEGVEYVNSFFRDQVKDFGWLGELKRRCEAEGVRSLLIMCDGLGALGDANAAARARAIENHWPWLDAAKFLGCHSIRVNAQSSGTWEEQRGRAAEGLQMLTEVAQAYDLNVIVENHGGLSSNGKWLSEVIRTVNLPHCGTLPDFGNFSLGDGKWYDRYNGVRELMPFAKAVSAKSHDFDANGEEKNTDYRKMLRIVLDAGYRGWIGVEYEGGSISEEQGILLTKALLERVREEFASEGG